MANKKETQSATFPDCPVRNVISRITDKWSLLVLYTLEHQEVMRFNDLWRQIPDISQKMLTTTLRHLEDDGIVAARCLWKCLQGLNIALRSEERALCRFWVQAEVPRRLAIAKLRLLMVLSSVWFF